MVGMLYTCPTLIKKKLWHFWNYWLTFDIGLNRYSQKVKKKPPRGKVTFIKKWLQEECSHHVQTKRNFLNLNKWRIWYNFNEKQKKKEKKKPQIILINCKTNLLQLKHNILPFIFLWVACSILIVPSSFS